MAQMDGQIVYLPNPLRDMNWPWARRMNPFYEEVKEEADYWFMSFKCFNETDNKNFIRCDFGKSATIANGPIDVEQQRDLLLCVTRTSRGVSQF